MKRVLYLQKQDSSWKITSEHTFNNRVYHVCFDGHFYRKGKKVELKADGVGSYTTQLVDDNGEKVRFKVHQIVGQTLLTTPLKDYHSIDHKNRIRTDNRPENLRVATRKQQYENRENKEYKYKKVKCINCGTVYKSCLHAENKIGLPKNTVSAVARGVKNSIRGYKFTYDF